MNVFSKLLKDNELWLMERILFYAKQQGYAKYTSTLVEAWRVSISGLSDAIIEGIELHGEELPEFLPEDTFTDDPLTHFGVKEASLHRKRGISLSMFLGFYKYYRYTFEDLVKTLDMPPAKKDFYLSFVARCFDRMEIAFCTRWSNMDGSEALTELQEANRLITNEKNKYLTLFESLDLPTFLIDASGILENLNVPASELLGRKDLAGSTYYAPDAQPTLKGQYLSDLLPWLLEPLERLLQGDALSCSTELEGSNELGGRHFKALLSRMRDVSGKFRGGVIVLEDISEQKRMERLKEDVERITKHDLKVPLSGMLSTFNYLVEDDDLSEEHRQMLSMARSSGYCMLDMINRSLDLFKMETGTYHFTPKCVDLFAVLQRVVENLQGCAKGHGVSIAISNIAARQNDHGKGPYLSADDMLLYTALGNLVANALEASPKGSCVDITISEDDACRVVIANKGGVPPEVRESFFEKYSTWGKNHGTGLGTYSARLIVETMEGEIAWESDGLSTEVTVSMPLGTAEQCN